MKGRRQKAEGRRVARAALGHPSSLALCLALAGGTGTVSAPAAAQVLTDPTRPPPGYYEAEPEGAAEVGGGLRLQSVMISPTHRSAIINGVMVKLGEKYGDAVLVKVGENEAVLKSGGVQQVLKLHPGVEKRGIAPAALEGVPRKGKVPGEGEPR
jgi:hypothetical protein